MTENKLELVAMGQHGVQLSSMNDLWEFAKAVSAGGLAPKSMVRPEQVMVAIQTGMEAGLSPMRALNSVVVINGAPSWKGDAARALILSAGVLVDGTTIREEWNGQGDDYGCTVTAWRIDVGEVSRRFTVADAKRANLWGKTGPWSTYPDRMLMYRALGFLARDHFADVLLGYRIEQEARDIPQEPREAEHELVTPTEHGLIEGLVDQPVVVLEGDPEPDAEHEQQREELAEKFDQDVDDHARAEWLAVVEERLGEMEPIEQSAFLAEHVPAGLESATTEQLEHIAGLLES